VACFLQKNRFNSVAKSVCRHHKRAQRSIVIFLPKRNITRPQFLKDLNMKLTFCIPVATFIRSLRSKPYQSVSIASVLLTTICIIPIASASDPIYPIPYTTCVEVPNSVTPATRTKWSARSDCDLADARLAAYSKADNDAIIAIDDLCEAEISEAEQNAACVAVGMRSVRGMSLNFGVWRSEFIALNNPNLAPVTYVDDAGANTCVLVRNLPALEGRTSVVDNACWVGNGFQSDKYWTVRAHAKSRCGVQCIR
jgi:hypothetical protein